MPKEMRKPMVFVFVLYSSHGQWIGVDNATYMCGKVEDMLPLALKQLSPDEDVVAILDPPRAGVHNKVIQAIRECEKLSHVVYIACDANKAVKNFLGLCRPTSNQYKGMPFRPARAVPVDLFPHTVHCELLVEFRRIPSEDTTHVVADSDRQET